MSCSLYGAWGITGTHYMFPDWQIGMADSGSWTFLGGIIKEPSK